LNSETKHTALASTSQQLVREHTVEHSKVLATHRWGLFKGRTGSKDVRAVSDYCCDTQGDATPSQTTTSSCCIETECLVSKGNRMKVLERPTENRKETAS